MSKSNETKAKLLGMPFGTASGKLRKSIIWYFVQEMNLDSCYRCEKRIETIDEMSIEHKENWQSATDPVESFFDIENIAFSHLFCNVGNTKRSKPNCANGHEYTEETTKIGIYGERNCRICLRAHDLKRRPVGSEFKTRAYGRSQGWKGF